VLWTADEELRTADFDAKGLSLILLAFFLPLAIYLTVLGLLNRRRHPLLVSGVWDGIGLLFGVSGFLFFAGPAVFSSLSERWRLKWLLGKGDAPLAGPDGAWQFWVFLSIVYFVLVVAGAAFYLWRQRHLTSIYNADLRQIDQALTQICDELGLNPVRSGGMLLFGLSLGLPGERRGGETLQAPHYLPTGLRASRGHLETEAASPVKGPADTTVLEQTAILELDSFPLMRHVTLRWDPADGPLRQVVETELARRLAQLPSGESMLGGCLLTLGCLLLAFVMAGVFLIFLINLIP
jgi:hypothetical protein